MSAEVLIVKFKLPYIYHCSFIEMLVSVGYQKTGNKFSVEFNGSKGYLSNVEISCEGIQPERNNVIWMEQLRTKKGHMRSKMVEVWHSDDQGVRVSI